MTRSEQGKIGIGDETARYEAWLSEVTPIVAADLELKHKVHLGSPNTAAIRADVKRRRKHWLYEAAGQMADAVDDDWRQWRKARR